MKIGTKSLLFGLHCMLLHPPLVLVAFIKCHRRLPDLAELCAIALHDLGYLSSGGIDSDGGEDHPHLGARIMRKLFGYRGWLLVIGHSKHTADLEGVPLSTLYLPDKEYYLLLPCWLHWLLAKASGEYKEYEKNNPIGFDPWMHRQVVKKRIADERWRWECKEITE